MNFRKIGSKILVLTGMLAMMAIPQAVSADCSYTPAADCGSRVCVQAAQSVGYKSGSGTTSNHFYSCTGKVQNAGNTAVFCGQKAASRFLCGKYFKWFSYGCGNWIGQKPNCNTPNCGGGNSDADIVKPDVPDNSGNDDVQTPNGDGNNGNTPLPDDNGNSGAAQKPDTDTNTETQKPGTDTNTETQKPDTSTNGGSTTAPGSDGNSGTAVSSYASQVTDLVNQQRSAKGLSALSYDSQLGRLAQLKAEDMAKNNYFSHQSPTYGSAFDMMKSAGVTYRSAGENIARGQKTPAAVMNSWMNSQGHRENILSTSYSSIGVGYATDAQGRICWVQMFKG